MKQTTVTVWSDAPKMTTGVPAPTFEQHGETVWLAYFTYRTDHIAVLQFSGVQGVTLSDPNDEALETHPLYKAGLDFYQFHEVHDDPAVSPPFRRWIATFHDDTFDIVAREVRIVVRAIQAPSPGHAIASVRA